jgi:hypothetical protein
MTPEAPGNLVVIDVSEDDDGFRYTVERWDPTAESRHFLWTLWAAEGDCPPGFVSAAGGAVCVAADPGYVHARYRARPRVRTDRRALSWADVAEGVGIMVVAVLPAGWVYDDGSLSPLEAKPFDGRMALYWRSGGGHNGEVRLTWTVKPIAGTLRDACAELNDSLSDALPTPDPPPPRRELLVDWAERQPPVQPLPPGSVISVQGNTVIIEGGLTGAHQIGASGPGAQALDFTQTWQQHASELPLDLLADQLERIRGLLAGSGSDNPALDDAVHAARSGDGPAVLRALRRAGQVVLDVATKVGADVAAAAAKAGLGL